jgi:uracil phosphoribosyltransferase
MPVVLELTHPLVKAHLTQLRNRSVEPPEFRALIRRLAVLLAYEATKDVLLQPVEIETPLCAMTGKTFAQRIGLVPILRAGLGMVDPILDLLPSAEVWHLGLYRDEATARPVEYYSKLPPGRPVDVAMVLDPMLATGGSASLAIEAVERWGVNQVKLLSVIAARDGVRAIQDRYPAAEIYVCEIDDELNSQKFIVPGLGDAGDRTFNTPGD